MPLRRSLLVLPAALPRRVVRDLLLLGVALAVTLVDPFGLRGGADGGWCVDDAAADGGTARVCTHLESQVRQLTAAEEATRDDAMLVCDGDGTSGRRIQVVYGHPEGTPSRLGRLRDALTEHVAAVQGDFDRASQRHGAPRALLPRVVEGDGPGCTLDIARMALPRAAVEDGAAMREHVRGLGRRWNRLDRTYLFLVDARETCGWANVAPDARRGPENENNTRRTTFIARVDLPCWASAATHEVAHTMGAVLEQAPHATAYGHCDDGRDVMCYDDDAPDAAYAPSACPQARDRFLLDCNADDYFAPTGRLGWWNVADSDWLFTAPLGATGASPGDAPPPVDGPGTDPGQQEPEVTVDPAEEQGAPSIDGAGGRATFADVGAGGPFASPIARLVGAGVTVGCNPPTNDRFCPGGTVTRAQLAAFLQRALDLPDGTARFADVPAGSPFAAAVGALAEAGITSGCAAGFCPSQPLTRGQLAMMLANAVDVPPGTSRFADVDPTSPFAAPIAALADAGVTEGCGPTRFCPSAPLTRAQLAAFLVRADVLG